jgi:hypothetical protein
MSARTRAATLTGAILAIAGLAGTASAATPITLSAGGKLPALAIDSAGSAHAVWVEGANVRYCKVPRGASACSETETFGPAAGDPAPPAHDPGAVRLFPPAVFTPAPGKVIVVRFLCCGEPFPNMRYQTLTSTDGGATFGSPVLVGATSYPAGGPTYPAHNAGATFHGPGNKLNFVSGFSPHVSNGLQGSSFTQTADDGSIVASTRAAVRPGEVLSATGGLDGSTPVVAYETVGAVRFRKYSGSGDINDAANWSPEALITSGPSYLTLAPYLTAAGGPSGLFLMRKSQGAGDPMVVQKLAGSAWTAPVALNDGGEAFGFSQSPSGQLGAIWDDGPKNLHYRTSLNGTAWSPTYKLHGNAEGSHENTRIAVAPDGRGWAMWNRQTASGSVKLIPLEPLAEDGPQLVAPPILTGLLVDPAILRPGRGARFIFTSTSPGLATLAFELRRAGLRLPIRASATRTTCLVSTPGRVRSLRRSLARSKSVRRLRGRARGRRLARLVNQRRCTAYQKAGEISKAVVAGRNTIVFSGKLRGRNLRPGVYRVTLTVTNAGGRATKRFTIRVRRPAPRRGGAGR